MGETRTLRDRNVRIENVCLNTYLNVFTLNVIHRFPNIRDLENVDENELRRIAEFSVICTSVVTEVWDRVTERESTRRAA